jgi:hypothetical protein
LASFVISASLVAIIIALVTLQSNAFAHPMICTAQPPESGFERKCVAIDTSSYMSEQYPVFYSLAPFLSWVGFLAFIGSMLFAVLVLIKNRARMIAC